eukprot:gene23706-32086_t
MDHRNNKENSLVGQTNYLSNRLESKSSQVDIDISSLKIGQSKYTNNRDDRSISQPNARNYQLNVEEGKVRSKSKGRSNSVRRLQNRQQQLQTSAQPQQRQPQQQQSKTLIDESNNVRQEFSSRSKNQNISSHGSGSSGGSSRNRDIHSNGTNENSNSNFQKSSTNKLSSSGSDRNLAYHHRPSAYGHHHPHARGGHSAIPPPYSYNPVHHHMAGGPYFNPHMQQQMNAAAGFGNGFYNNSNSSTYPVVEIFLTARDHEIFCAEQQESCSTSQSPSQSEHGMSESEQELQRLLEQTWAETDEMLCDQRDNIMQFYEAMKQAQIASWLNAQSLEEQRLYLDRTKASVLKTAQASVC